MDPTRRYPPAYLKEDRSQELVRAVVAIAVLDTFFVLLFFVSRFLNKTAKGWDVYLMVPSYLCCLGNIIVATLSVQDGGLGRHIVALQPTTIVRFLKLIVAEEFMYSAAMVFPKLVILCFYARIFTIPVYRRSIYAIGTLVILTCIGAFIGFIAICRPFHYNWQLKIPHDHCGDLHKFFIWMSVPHLMTDVALVMLPLVGVWRLQINTKNKIDLSFTFLTGCVGCIAGITRLVLFVRTDILNDSTYQATRTSIWSTVEPGIYLIAAALPSLRPLLRMTLSGVESSKTYKLMQSRSQSRSQSTKEFISDDMA